MRTGLDLTRSHNAFFVPRVYSEVHPDAHSVLSRLIATGHLFAPPASRPGVGVPFPGNRLGCVLDLQSHANEFTIAFENDSGFLEGVANCNEILCGSPPPCMFKML